MQFRKVFITSLVFLLLLTTINVKTEAAITPIVVSKYNDFHADQDWAKAFEWGITNAIIKGYINQPHPTTKKYGTWLNPNGKLTEYQYLIMLFRYLAPAEFALHEKAVGPQDWYGTPVYSLTWDLNIPYEFTGTSYTPNKQIRRGETARILASSVTGKEMTEQDAVQWLYDNGVSIGYPDKDGNYPKTYESFQADDLLTRGQGITFLHRYSLTDLPKSLTKIPTVEQLRVEPIKTVLDTFNANNTEHPISQKDIGSQLGIIQDSKWIMIIYPYVRVPGQTFFLTKVAEDSTLFQLSVDLLVALPDYPLDKATTIEKMQEVMKADKQIVVEKNGYTIRFSRNVENNEIFVGWTKN